MWASAKTVGLVIALVGALLPLGSIGGHETGAPQTDTNEIFMVSLGNPALKESLPGLGIEILVDYSNGLYLARGSTPDLAPLEGIGIDAWEIPNRTILTFPESGYGFDTRAGPPSLPPNLASSNTPEKIVQFIGPIKSEWVAAVESTGARMEEYVDSYAFVAVMSDAQVESARSFAFVNWIGPYEPAYKVQSGLLWMEDIVPVSVIAHDGVDESRLRTVLEGFGADIVATWTMPVTAEARIDASFIPEVAKSPDVLSISLSPEKKPLDWAAGEIHHFHDAWMPLRSGIPFNLTGHSPGPDGIQGTSDDIFETVGITDTGFDANSAAAGWPDLFSGPLGDRVVALRRRTAACTQPDGRTNGIAHGTIVVGTVLSNGYGWEKQYGEPVDDFVWDKSEAGVVPEGLLSFDCAFVPSGEIAASPAYWDDEYADGAKTISNSYGAAYTTYGPFPYAVDARVDASNDKMIIFAAGNDGPEPNTINGLSLGKNGLAVGASENFRPDRPYADDPNIIPDFSSRGNPGDRIKPDLVTVGTAVVSGLGFGEWQYNAGPGGRGVPQVDYIMGVDQYDYRIPGAGTDGIPDYRYYTGTSVSAPHAAGLYMLTREYFREMYGIDNVNSQLAKAMLINGAVRMDPALYEYPGIEQGWGRIDLEQFLFPPAPRSNQWEEGYLTTTGTWTPSGINTYVVSPDVPLKVTLVWIDAPSSVLVRNLDLIVRDPSGTLEYHGNQYAESGLLKGYTDPTATGYDIINNVEQVEVRDPTPGTWSVEVRGTSIPSTAKFALVFSADVGPRRDYQVSLSTNHTTTLEVVPGGTTNLPFTVTNFGTNDDVIAVSDDAPSEITVSYDWVVASFVSTEARDDLAMFTVAQNATPGVRSFLICGKSEDDPTIPEASDCISVQVAVITMALPPRYDVTSGGGNEMEPTVLTFTQGGVNHVFVAYKKITPLNYSDLTHGGTNVWVAHNTVDDNHVPNGTWTQQCVSDWNEQPNDIRMLRIDNGTFDGRIVITWSGKDPLETNPDKRPWSRIAFSDPPYTDWTLKTIQKNYGSNAYNAVRVGFPLFRKSGGPNGTLVYIWEHLDSTTSDALMITAVQTHATFSFDGGSTWGDCFATPGQCYQIAPKFTSNYYFFPGGAVDQNDVLWVFFYWRAPTGTSRKLAVALWDGSTWQTGWTAPINIWDPGPDVNLRFPSAVSTTEGGNRVYVAVTSDDGGADEHIFVLYAEGTYGSGIVGPQPVGAPMAGLSPDFSQPQGPMGSSVLSARYDSGPVLNAVHTDDGLTWLPYIESKHVPGGMTNLSTWFSPNAFTDRELLDVTGDAYAKGHQMSDTLTTPVKSCVYEVWHESRERFERASYDIRLAVYCDGWQSSSDTTGPLTKDPATIPNPYDKTYSTSFRVVAEISDYTTGFSNVTSAEMVLTDTSVNSPRLVDWSNAWQMNLTGYDRSPVETAWLWANETAAGWSLGPCHRFWIRGGDEKGNWGLGDYVDVCVIASDVFPAPPMMTAAKLTGPGYMDVELAWLKSPSDGGGSGIVTSYKVSRTPSVHGPFIVVANVTATGAASYRWTDVGAGHGDARNFFYNVVASSLTHDSAPSRLAGKFTRTMDGGKQLVSFPLEQADNDPLVVFQTISYAYARTYVAGTPNPWWCHKPGLFINSLAELNVAQGYWVELDGPGTMTVAGLVPRGLVMHLKSGWNMIGFPSFDESYSFADLNAAISGMLQLVEMYDASEGPYYLQKVHRNVWASTYLTPGYAYMIRVSSDVNLAVPGY